MAPCRQLQRHGWDGLSSGDGGQDGQLLWAQGANLPGLHAGPGDSGLVRAEESHHRVANGGTEAFDEVGPPFAHRYPEPGVALGGLKALHLQGTGGPILEADAGHQARQAFVRGRALHFGQVGARHLEAWVQKSVRCRPVVGEE
jgi:hypothetical protein